MPIQKIAVIGMGGVGGLVASLLKEELGFDVIGIDRDLTPFTPPSIQFHALDVTDQERMKLCCKEVDAIVSCLPFYLTKTIAELAYALGAHYFDPTEDVATTDYVRQLASHSKGVMIPQNGLAPGFIGIIGADLANQFDEGTLRHIKLRVGALPEHPIGQLGYAGNWSLEGLVHEYIAPCDVIIDGIKQKIPPLRNPEILRIHGVEYEAFTTSGGLGTMTETYAGKVETLDYKSIRYPGHLEGMRLLLEELRFRDDPESLVNRLRYALPPDDQDRVLIHASVQGAMQGMLQTKEMVMDYKPIQLAGKKRTAIAWTTAASMVAVIEMVHRGTLPNQGFVKQEEIPLYKFLATNTGSLYTQHRVRFSQPA